MNSAHNIVVGLDLDPKTCAPTPGSLAAVQTAKWWAQHAKAHVTLLHSLARDEYFDPLVNELVPICDTVTPEGRTTVSEIVAHFRAANVPCETVDSSERPSIAITRELQRQHAGLALLGKHDGRESDATRIGPIALRVLRECPAAVWTVVPGRPIEPRRVLATTDFSQVGDEATRQAARIADFAHGELHVVHVHPPTLHSRGADSATHLRRLQDAMMRPLTEAQRERAQFHLREAAPAQGVLELVEELEPDLVVLGIFSHAKSPQALVGSTAERLLARIDTSILALKPS